MELLAQHSGLWLLGLAAALFVLLNGRILGISGILGGLLRAGRECSRPQRARADLLQGEAALVLVLWRHNLQELLALLNHLCGAERDRPAGKAGALNLKGR